MHMRVRTAAQAADKCLELEPTFVKGYSRKGTLQFFMKEYDKALETYRTGGWAGGWGLFCACFLG